ncbi:Aquaporin-12 [Orchesella cincta]|uniref:Aquaporin n=1 Tax=Orchesella cincta TaxID=48709 RepID=A0A1D2MNC6_ORCCI|nr:Aquaporin-12 [Orchesella cincta]
MSVLAIRKWVETSTSEYTDLKLSLGFIVATLFAAEFTRLCVKWVLKDPQGLTRRLIMECLAAGEMCGACFELCVIADNYGIWMYAVTLYAMCLWWAIFWNDATACPYTHVEDFVSGHSGFNMTVLIILIEILGGIAAYPLYVKKFWLYKFIPIHAQRIYRNRCPADLTLPAWQGALVEGVGTCICQLCGRVMGKFNWKLSALVVNFVNVSLVVAAWELSGGYYNPVLATALQYNCGEVSRTTHFTVYWGGAIGGSILSVLLWNHRTVHYYLMYGPPKPKTE